MKKKDYVWIVERYDYDSSWHFGVFDCLADAMIKILDKVIDFNKNPDHSFGIDDGYTLSLHTVGITSKRLGDYHIHTQIQDDDTIRLSERTWTGYGGTEDPAITGDYI